MSALPSFRPGFGTSLKDVMGGQIISVAAAARSWQHPWSITPAWQAGRRWVATVKPGFVGAKAPVYFTTTAAQKGQGDVQWGINPLTGERFFSSFVFAHAQSVATSPRISVPLYLAPAIELLWRAVGYDGAPDEGVPKFFRDRGVQAAPVFDASAAAEGTVSGQLDHVPGLRLLRACDLVLHQPRFALTSSVTVDEAGAITGRSLVTQTLGVRAPSTSDALRVIAGQYAPPAPPDPLSGDYEEPTWDELVIGTVYLLSPLRTAPGSAPNGAWTPYVRHSLFWNLNYQPAPFRAGTVDPDVPFIPPLAGGVAQLAIAGFEADLNDRTQQALNILTGHSLAGTFWTPTGGGSSSEFPQAPQPQAAGKTGLDRAGRTAALTAQRAAQTRSGQLDPAYPFRAMPATADLFQS